MAVSVEEVRRLDGGSPPAKDVTARLVAKAAAAFGLPNLVLASAGPSRRKGSEDQESILWECESRCSCTPLACISATSGRGTERGGEGKAPKTPAVLDYPATTTAGNDQSAEEDRPDAVENSCCRSLSTDNSLSYTEMKSQAQSQEASIVDSRASSKDGRNLAKHADNLISSVTISSAESGEGMSVKDSVEKPPLKEDNTEQQVERQIKTEGKPQAERTGAVSQPEASVTHRRRRAIADFEKEWTFRPRLNLTSLRLASHCGRSSVPVSHRLYQRKTFSVPQLQEEFTFAPKLNAASLRLAQGRADRLPEVQERMSQLATQRLADACVHCTFHPSLSQRSLRMARRMEAGFQARQQQLLLKRQKTMEEVSATHLHNYCNKSRPITLPTTTPPPLPRRHSVTPSPHSHPHRTTPTSSDSRQVQFKGRLLANRPNHSSSSSSSSSDGKRRRSSSKTSSLQDSSSVSNGNVSVPERQRPTSTPPGRPSPSSSSSTTPVSSPKKRSLQVEAGGSYRTSNATQIAPDGPWSRLNDTDRLKRVKFLAERAIKKKKVFVCRGGYCTIRRCLRERGWVEKDHKETESPYLAKRAVGRRAKSGGEGVAGGHGISRDSSHTHHCDSDSSDNGEVVEREKCAGVEGADDDMGEQKYHMLCRAVRNADPNFVWTLRRDDSLYHNLLPSAFANHFAKASSFTTKVGLCANLRNLVWCGETHSDLFFPRCFLLSSLEEKDSFINDYRFTTALNILKLVTDQQWGRFQSPHNTFSPTPSPATTTTPHTAQNTPQQTGSVTEGSSVKIGLHSPPCEPPVVPEEAVGLALRACSAYVSSRLHEDIEEESKCLELTGTEWQSLINYCYKIVLEGGKFACSTQTVRKASDMLDELEKYLPQLYMDGVRNIWIVKPGAMSRGRGIVCLERLEPILELVSSPFHKEGKWVVQKYIERPLLIYGTKFDIRQWFLITDWAPLTMWMYKDCYLRFATQRFTLDNMNESVHLCNNSIQRYYTNSGSRSELLPEENMWHSSTFKDYLECLGQDGVWDEVIYPGMKHALTCAMMVSQDIVEGRKNSFELYGADFMLTDDFKPWLIEINCSPTMEPSTSVTSQLCAQVMEDTIRVVVDRRENKEASTGKFELAYRQPKFDTPSYIGIQLCVEGVAIHRSHTHHRSAPAIPVANISYTKT